MMLQVGKRNSDEFTGGQYGEYLRGPIDSDKFSL